jgi:di/tricarboxylate transporter
MAPISTNKFFAERVIMVAAATVVLGLATWMTNKTQTLAEAVPVMQEQIKSLRRDVDNLSGKRPISKHGEDT